MRPFQSMRITCNICHDVIVAPQREFTYHLYSEHYEEFKKSIPQLYEKYSKEKNKKPSTFELEQFADHVLRRMVEYDSKESELI